MAEESVARICAKHPESKRYKDGKCAACVCERAARHYVVSRAAHNARTKAWYEANREKAKAAARAWREANLDRAKANNKTYHEANREKRTADHLKWRKDHPEKAKAWLDANRDRLNALRKEKHNASPEKSRAARKAWTDANRELVRAGVNARGKRVRRRTPLWANREAIRAIYAEAARLGLTVDHIVPLQGKLVSGLHVEHNLQLLSKAKNSAKHCKFDPLTHVHELPKGA